MLIELSKSFFPQTLTDLATIAQGIGSMVVLLFVYKQIKQTNEIIKQTKEETEIRLRPWIGVESVSFDNYSDENFLITYRLKNYGESPAISIKTYSKYFNQLPNIISDSYTIFEEELVYENDDILVPNESMKYNVKIPKSELIHLKNQGSKIFVYFSMKHKHYASGNEKEGLFEFVDEILDENSLKRVKINLK